MRDKEGEKKSGKGKRKKSKRARKSSSSLFLALYPVLDVDQEKRILWPVKLFSLFRR